eukprot:m.481962 g.481962  ORF g.481962 m.481962 type:complete len:80 (+) comp58569_c0_seq1:130-369(+)
MGQDFAPVSVDWSASIRMSFLRLLTITVALNQAYGQRVSATQPTPAPSDDEKDKKLYFTHKLGFLIILVIGLFFVSILL